MSQSKPGRKVDPIVVIGIGSDLKGDDAVGLILARRLAKLESWKYRVVESAGDGRQIMDAWRGAARALVIMATRSGSRPGRIHRHDASKRPVPASFIENSDHRFSLSDAVEEARTEKSLPVQLVVYGIEGEGFDTGEPLSDSVASAMKSVVAKITAEEWDKG